MGLSSKFRPRRPGNLRIQISPQYLHQTSRSRMHSSKHPSACTIEPSPLPGPPSRYTALLRADNRRAPCRTNLDIPTCPATNWQNKSCAPVCVCTAVVVLSRARQASSLFYKSPRRARAIFFAAAAARWCSISFRRSGPFFVPGPAEC